MRRTLRSSQREALAARFAALIPVLRRRFDDRVSPEIRCGLSAVTGHQAQALCSLRGLEGGLTMNELAQRHGTALSTATALADRLLKAGLAERRADPADRRVVRLVATPEGERFMERYRELKVAAVLQALDLLDDDEFQQLVRLIEKIAGVAPAGTVRLEERKVG